jgi:asparagine synthase (glutamine-hydrolysing)
MSGIAALVNPQGPAQNEQLIIDMATLMTMRGPAYAQYWHEDNIALAHTLLPTTLRSANESQPCTFDGQVWITADVRIDARTELIHKLQVHRPEVTSRTTDDQLVLHAYHLWGVDCLHHMIGDFAFIIWDSENQRLFCASDQFGVAPLYYAATSQGLCVSNTLNAIRLHPDVSNRLDELAIADYLLFRINENGGGTSFEKIKRVPAGHLILYENQKLTVKPYWSLKPRGQIRHTTPAQYLEEFSDLLKQAVADRLDTHNVGVHLSGGMDSSSVTALACELAGSENITAYTYGASGSLPDLESPFANKIADQYGIKHHMFRNDDMTLDHKAVPQDLRSPEPRFTTRETTNYKLLSHISTHSSVLLTGFGGDPLLHAQALSLNDFNSPVKFYSQMRHLHSHWKLFGKRPPLGMFTSSKKARIKKLQQREIPHWFNQDFANKHEVPERYRSLLLQKNDPYGAQVNMTNSGLWRRIFSWNDPGFTHIPVKFLHPFFDTRLLSYTQNLPPFPWLHDKTILRQAMQPYLPSSVTQRPKTPLPGNGLQSVLSTQAVPENYIALLDNPLIKDYVETASLKLALSNRNTSTKADFKAIMRVITLSDWLIGYEKKPILPTFNENQQHVKRIKYQR